MRLIEIEIAYATTERQSLLRVSLPEGSDVRSALQAHAKTLGVDASRVAALGIWGQVVEGTAVLKSGDRLEIYRALPLDPKEKRRRFARKGHTMADATLKTARKSRG